MASIGRKFPSVLNVMFLIKGATQLDIRQPLQQHLTLLILAVGLAFPRAASADEPAGLKTALRAAIDQVADALENEPIDQEKVDFGDNLGIWLVSQSEIPLAEEAKLSAAMAGKIAAGHRITPAPARLAAIWKKLLDELPEKFQPREWQFKLEIIEAPQCAAFSTGAGRVFLSQPLVAALEKAGLSDDALAFVLAHQLGHVARGHCTNGYLRAQYDALPAEEHNRTRDDLVHRMMKTQFAPEGSLSLFVYTPGQQYEADVFAMHLCRNAGYDQLAALDVLRLYALQEEENYLPEDNRAAAIAALGDGFAGYEACAAPAKRRLQHARRELAGIPDDPSDRGIVTYDPKLGAFGDPARDASAQGRAVVFVHGMEGELSRYHDMAKLLASQTDAQGITILGFRYPDDDSLSKSATFLQREVSRVCGDASQVDFVCHSAGGLVFRYYSEVLGGKYRQALLHGTPQLGSQLARLRTWLEMGQLVRGFRVGGVSEAVEASVLDGSGQISYDLEPDSLFLTYLNRKVPDSRRIHAYRGQILTRFQAAAARLAVNGSRLLAMEVVRNQVDRPQLQATAQRVVESLDLPEEIFAGDGLVSLRSALLPGADIHTSNHDHLTLTTAEENLVDGVARILAGP